MVTCQQSYIGCYVLFLVTKTCGITTVVLSNNDYELISSPGYPQQNYYNDASCTWYVNNTDTSKVLTFQMVSMETEIKNDIIEVRDGKIDGHILGAFSGSELPGTLFSTSYEMTVTFQSDAVNNMKGFQANISSGKDSLLC